jgi:hypothetical protein
MGWRVAQRGSLKSGYVDRTGNQHVPNEDSGRVAVELVVGFSDGVALTDGGHDLDSYLFPVAQQLGPQRVAAIFGRKIHGRRH